MEKLSGEIEVHKKIKRNNERENKRHFGTEDTK
jgi:hypothetical protein